ncbi:DMT family transporter [Shewanella khirikhana]|uniref:Threonine/homoserine exporter RhtA n=1 Tax=Shewanella khirikhana TaxID=1965282 RepID=A0ABM7DQP8_9GAMM|nr:DMT family transporter [Shewanella khirikhana]AZQ12017.1 Threonine/homoserine exporter RhtA [Shewanella khirikhana]
MSKGAPSGLLELHLAVLLFGGTALFSKLIPLGALDITVFRCAIATLVLALIVKLSRQPIRLRQLRDYGIALMLGVIVSLHWVTYFASMQMSSVAIGMIAFFTYPVMTVLVEPWVNGTRLQLQDIICGIAVLTGVALLIPEASLGNDVTLGILIGILSAALFTARNLLHKRYFAQYSGPQAMFYQTAVAAVFLGSFVESNPTELDAHVWQLLLLLGVVFTAMPHALFTSALRHLSAKTVGLVSCLQPFYGTVLALLLLGESPSSSTLIGGLLVVATAVFETTQSHRSQRQKKA